MPENLFVALWKRRAHPDRDPHEDYVTDAFAWLLGHEPGLGGAFAEWLAIRGGWQESAGFLFEWRTQEHLRAKGTEGIVDLVGRSTDCTLLIENKLGAKLSDNQLPRYHELGDHYWPGRHRVVLITSHKHQHTQPADLCLTWSEVMAFLDRHLPKPQCGISMTHEFITFMTAKGLGPQPLVTAEAIQGYIPAQTLVPALEALFERLPRSMDSARLQPVRDALGVDCAGEVAPMPVVQPFKWGRIGLQMPSWSPWRPAIFVGVMLDGSDHRIGLSSPERGPDFTVILSVHQHPGKPEASEIIRHEAFIALRHRLASDHGPFRFIDHLAADHRNPWHPIHLQRPLVDVLAGTHGPEQQERRMEDEIHAGVELLLRGGEVARMVAEFKGKYALVR